MENPFELILKRLDEIEAKIDGIVSVKDQPSSNQKAIMNTEEIAVYLNLSKATIYTKTFRNEIPHMKKNGKLYFDLNEVNAWLKTGKRKALFELDAEAQQYLIKKHLGL